MNILLVEDDDAVRKTLLDVLRYKQHTVESAVSAEEALDKLPGDYHVIISDILLTEMNGIELLERVNRMDLRIPVLMITGFGGSDIENRCREKGAAGFLNKPFSVKRLLTLVEEVGKRFH